MGSQATFDTILPGNPNYPAAIADIFGLLAAPPIWAAGNLGLLRLKSVGFCGSRSVSEQGLWVAKDSAQQLAEAGVVVVSGYAKGVDTAAHLAALKSGGTTIIILPEGCEHFRQKLELRADWDWQRILVLSQFEPKAVWRADRAMERNKLIVALTDATFVIEAGATGGTLNAGMLALRLKKPLFVAKYSSVETVAPGNALLLKSGGEEINKSRRTARAELGPLFSKIEG